MRKKRESKRQAKLQQQQHSDTPVTNVPVKNGNEATGDGVALQNSTVMGDKAAKIKKIKTVSIRNDGSLPPQLPSVFLFSFVLCSHRYISRISKV